MTDSKYCRVYSSITVQSIRCYVRGYIYIYIYCKMIAADIIPDDVAEKTVR